VPAEAKVRVLCEALENNVVNPPGLAPADLADGANLRDLCRKIGMTADDIDDFFNTIWCEDNGLRNGFLFDGGRAGELAKYISGKYLIRRRPSNLVIDPYDILAMVIESPAPASTRQNEQHREYVPTRLSIRSKMGEQIFWYQGAFALLPEGFSALWHQIGSFSPDTCRLYTTCRNPNQTTEFDGLFVTMTEAVRCLRRQGYSRRAATRS
jgi:hypothetical protein